MKLLLDTHIWLWNLQGSSKLARGVRKLLSDENNELWLSPVSTWEALLLQARGAIFFRGDWEMALEAARSRMREAPLTHEIVLAAHLLPFSHKDPADRFLAATAKVLGLTLVTADTRLLGLGDVQTLANR
jgi:PIN domain nuclease of toxin-antitoxin system